MAFLVKDLTHCNSWTARLLLYSPFPSHPQHNQTHPLASISVDPTKYYLSTHLVAYQVHTIKINIAIWRPSNN